MLPSHRLPKWVPTARVMTISSWSAFIISVARSQLWARRLLQSRRLEGDSRQAHLEEQRVRVLEDDNGAAKRIRSTRRVGHARHLAHDVAAMRWHTGRAHGRRAPHAGQGWAGTRLLYAPDPPRRREEQADTLLKGSCCT
jgi:hypothetical protein